MLVHSMDEIKFNMFILKEFYIMACGVKKLWGDLFLVHKMIMMNMATPIKMKFSEANLKYYSFAICV